MEAVIAPCSSGSRVSSRVLTHSIKSWRCQLRDSILRRLVILPSIVWGLVQPAFEELSGIKKTH